MEEVDRPLQERVVAAVGAQYEIEGEIGRGGMSVVYRARDRRLDRPVAIKVLPPELAFDPAIRMRFTREAQTSARLAHPHIVPIYDVGEREGVAWFVMPVVGGGSLAGLLAREPRQPVEEVRRLVAEAADALAYAHARGIVHRDVKPDNILLDADSGRVLVTDFGIARAVEAGTRLTITGNAIGTPTYMSPEQAMGEREVDGRGDIYSLGVVAYQMLTGRVPFTAGNSMALLLKHVSESPTPIAELRPDVPRGLREAIERALLKSPDERWPTAAALRDALRAGDAPAAPWRPETREPVRYASPKRGVPRGRRAPDESHPPVAGTGGPGPGHSVVPRLVEGVEVLPPHVVAMSTAQREDMRLWGGRIGILDRVKATRGLFWLTVATALASLPAVAVAIDEGAVPLIVAPIVPWLLGRTLRRRMRSLRESGLRIRRVFLMPRARMVLPKPAPAPETTETRLERLAGRDVLDGAHGAAIRRADADRAAILEAAASLPAADRALIPDVTRNVEALVSRVAQLAQMLQRLDESVDPRQLADLDARIAAIPDDGASPDDAHRLTLLRRQRASAEELMQRRAALARQLESAGLVLGSLRLDLARARSTGLQSSLADLSSATQDVRALSRDIDAMLEAAAEVRAI